MKRAENEGELRVWEDADRFRLLVEGVNDYAIFMLDPEGRVLTWNSGARKLKGYRPDEIIGQHFSIFYSDADRADEKPERELEIAIRTGRYEEEGWRFRKDGTRFWASVVISLIRDSSGTIRGFAKVTRDLSERREAAEKLKQSEARLSVLIDSIKDYAIFMLDIQGHVATWNEGAQRIKQYKPAEIIGRHFSVFYPEEDVRAGKCERELDIATATGRFEEEGWRVRKDGTLFWANVVISAARDTTGRLIGFAKVTRDLTDRKRADEERLRLARAEEGVRLRDEFLSIASHELKTPLTSLQLQVSGMQRGLRKGIPAPEAYDKLVGRVDLVARGLDRLEQLIDALLDVSRAAAGRLQLIVEDVDAGLVIREVAGRFSHQLAAAGCTLSIDLGPSPSSPPSPIIGRWDRLRLEQIVTNFLSNAIKYGARKPIAITARVIGDQAIIAVRDHGIGVSAEDQLRIFNRFERAVPVSNYGGLGLGLWIVRLIAEALGGTVSVESRPGEGATFTASLPLAGKLDEQGEQAAPGNGAAIAKGSV